jgi:hypothetical protein
VVLLGLSVGVRLFPVLQQTVGEDCDETMDDVHNPRLRERPKKDSNSLMMMSSSSAAAAAAAGKGLVSSSVVSIPRFKRKRQGLHEIQEQQVLRGGGSGNSIAAAAADEGEDTTHDSEMAGAAASEDDDDLPPPTIPRRPAKSRPPQQQQGKVRFQKQLLALDDGELFPLPLCCLATLTTHPHISRFFGRKKPTTNNLAVFAFLSI